MNTLELQLEDGQKLLGSWKLDGETLTLSIEEKEYIIESKGDLSVGVINFIKTLQKRILKKPLRLNSCLTCTHFVMSGMARDMGRGQRGVCYNNKQGGEICYKCEDYVNKNC